MCLVVVPTIDQIRVIINVNITIHIPVRIKNTIPVIKYHIINFLHPIFPILLNICMNLNAALISLSWLAIFAIAIKIMGAMMNSYKMAMKNQIPAHAMRSQIPFPPIMPKFLPLKVHIQLLVGLM